MYVRSTFVDLNPIKSNYYPFMISLDKCNGSCNVADGCTRFVHKVKQMITITNSLLKRIVKFFHLLS